MQSKDRLHNLLKLKASKDLTSLSQCNQQSLAKFVSSELRCERRAQSTSNRILQYEVLSSIRSTLNPKSVVDRGRGGKVRTKSQIWVNVQELIHGKPTFRLCSNLISRLVVYQSWTYGMFQREWGRSDGQIFNKWETEKGMWSSASNSCREDEDRERKILHKVEVMCKQTFALRLLWVCHELHLWDTKTCSRRCTSFYARKLRGFFSSNFTLMLVPVRIEPMRLS